MAEAQQVPEEFQQDKVPEAKMAAILGTTKRALEGKCARGIIPQGVWNNFDGRILYSVGRYEAWLESQWACPPELNLQASRFESASRGREKGVAKRLPIPNAKGDQGCRRFTR